MNTSNVLLKYADDTYRIVPASSITTRQNDIINTENLSQKKQPAVKPCQVSCNHFTVNRRKHEVQPPSKLPGIGRVDILKILGVTVSSRITVSEHIDRTLCSYAQTVYILKTLTAHGMNAECLNIFNNIFTAIILAKLTERAHGLDSLVHPKETESKRSYVDASVPDCSEDTATFTDLCDTVDERLSPRVKQHKLHLFDLLLYDKSTANRIGGV